MCIYIYCVTTINEKRGHELGREKEGAYGRTWAGTGEVRIAVIIISTIKEESFPYQGPYYFVVPAGLETEP